MESRRRRRLLREQGQQNEETDDAKYKTKFDPSKYLSDSQKKKTSNSTNNRTSRHNTTAPMISRAHRNETLKTLEVEDGEDESFPFDASVTDTSFVVSNGGGSSGRSGGRVRGGNKPFDEIHKDVDSVNHLNQSLMKQSYLSSQHNGNNNSTKKSEEIEERMFISGSSSDEEEKSKRRVHSLPPTTRLTLSVPPVLVQSSQRQQKEQEQEQVKRDNHQYHYVSPLRTNEYATKTTSNINKQTLSPSTKSTLETSVNTSLETTHSLLLNSDSPVISNNHNVQYSPVKKKFQYSELMVTSASRDEDDESEVLWQEAEEKWKIAAKNDESYEIEEDEEDEEPGSLSFQGKLNGVTNHTKEKRHQSPQDNIERNAINKNQQPDSILRTSNRYKDSSASPPSSPPKHGKKNPPSKNDDNAQATSENETSIKPKPHDSKSAPSRHSNADNMTEDDSLFHLLDSVQNGTAVSTLTDNNKKFGKNPPDMKSKMITIKPKKHHKTKTGMEGKKRIHHNDGSIQQADEDQSLQQNELQPWSAREKGDQHHNNRKDGGRKSAGVAFADERKNTVHEFSPERNNHIISKRQLQTATSSRRRRNSWATSSDDDASYSVTSDVSEGYSIDDTYAGHSMSSEYVKSYESEAEDMVKDFFFIGSGESTNPGRRKLKHRYSRKGQYGESRQDKKKSKKEKKKQIPTEQIVIDKSIPNESNQKREDNENISSSNDVVDDDVDPLKCVWSFMEEGVSVVKDALGLTSDEVKDTQEENDNKKTSEESPKEPPKEQPHKPKEIGTTLTHQNSFFMQYASNFLTEDGPFKECSEQDLYSVGTLEGANISRCGSNDMSESGVPKDSNGLYQAALAAAENVHFVNQIPFIRNVDIDVVKDIKFIMVTIPLPVGILFQENVAGCWIARLDKSGNARKLLKNNPLEVGDQLAAINGINAINQNIKSISSMLSKSPGHISVDLTFLRYVGIMQGEVPVPLKKTGSLIKKVSFRKGKSDVSNIPGISQTSSADETIDSLNKKPASPLRKFANKMIMSQSNKDIALDSDTEVHSRNDDYPIGNDGKQAKVKKKFSLFKKGKKNHKEAF